MKRAGLQKGKHGGYRQTTKDERLLAVLRVESGVPIATVANEFGVSIATGVKHWIDEMTGSRELYYEDKPSDKEIERAPSEEWARECAAGYVFSLVTCEQGYRGHWRCEYDRTQGPRWTPTLAAVAATSLAKQCLIAAIASSRSIVAPSQATLLAIGRLYRCLDAETQALYAPIWDQCQMAIDEIEQGRARLRRAVDIAATVQP